MASSANVAFDFSPFRRSLDVVFRANRYTHVLPQLRKSSWFGRGIVETVQGPGETIYVPHGMGHSVLNLDENVSVTENFLPSTALDEMAQFFAYSMNPFHFESAGASERIWKNLINRDLDKNTRRYLKAVLKQVLSVEPPENIPDVQEDY